ncbi:MAG: accessory gene regulator B family protein [Lachnospiraceae bacterium]|nr:accessory gene regulator B family protein [Lachnospiraceae bacterium]
MVISYYVSKKLTDTLFELNIIEKNSIDSYQFCFEYTLDIILFNTSLILFGALLHDIIGASLYMIIMFILKTTAGGAHANSRFACSFFSYGIFFLILPLSHHMHFINTISPSGKIRFLYVSLF